MNSPVQAILWQIWRGWRWGLLLGGAYLLVAILVVQFLPDILAARQWEAYLAEAGVRLATPCAFFVIHLIAAFSLIGSEITATGYSRHALSLPVSTRTLVICPVVAGCLTLTAVWMLIAGLILRPTGNPAPLIWPAAALGAALGLFQTITWMPLAQTWIGIFIAVPAFVLLLAAATLAAAFQVSDLIAAPIFLAMTGALYVTSLRGVERSRRGDVLDWSFWHRLVAWFASWRNSQQQPFRSPQHAQTWFECRRFAATLPLFVLVLAPFLVLLSLFSPNHDPQTTWKMLAALLLMPALLASFLGVHNGETAFPYAAVRPLSTARMVRSKFEMAAISACAAYLPVLAVLPWVLLRPEIRTQIIVTLQSLGWFQSAGLVLAVTLVPLVLTWRSLVQMMWVGLFGSSWLINGIPLVWAAIWGVGTLVGLWVWLHPDWIPVVNSLVPHLIRGLLVVKLLIAVAVLGSVRRARLLANVTLGWIVLSWIAVVGATTGVLVWLIPNDLATWSAIATGVLLVIPFSRLVGAPLALHLNRHR